METTVAILVGIGLAASCGFRVFVPLLVASAAAHAGYLEVAPGFDWLVTWPATIALAIAAVIEVAAFYIPLVDNLLDAIASPIAVIAGAVLFAAVAFELNPFLRWTLAVVAGGGSAALVQAGTVATRAASTGTTAGLANFVVNTAETLLGVTFSTMAIALPLAAIVLLAMLTAAMFYLGRRVLWNLLPPKGD